MAVNTSDPRPSRGTATAAAVANSSAAAVASDGNPHEDLLPSSEAWDHLAAQMVPSLKDNVRDEYSWTGSDRPAVHHAEDAAG